MDRPHLKQRSRQVRTLFGCVALALAASGSALGAGADVPLAPDMGGPVGVLRADSAKTLMQGAFSIGAHGTYFNSNELLNALRPDLSIQRLTAQEAVGVGILDWLEGFISTTSSSTSLKDPSVNEQDLIQALGDLEIGGKMGYMSPEGLGIGVDAFVQFLTNVQKLGYNPDATSYGLKLLWTLDLTTAYNTPLRFHVNVGYHKDNSKYLWPREDQPFEYGLRIFRDDQFLGALAVEVPTETVTPFLEYSTEQLWDNDHDAPQTGSVNFNEGPQQWSRNPQRLTPGLRITPVRGLAVDVGVDLGFFTKSDSVAGATVRTVPLWTAVLGVSYTFVPAAAVVVQKVEAPLPTTGKVAGRVVDSKTQQPVGAAVITMVGTGLSNLSTDPTSGTYSTPDLPAGAVDLMAQADDYASQTVRAVVVAGQTVTQDIALEHLTRAGQFRGRVLEKGTGKPLAAVLSFDNKDLHPGTTNPASGEFAMNLPPGDFQASAAAQGYKPETKPISIQDKQTTNVDFELEPEKPPEAPPLPERKPTAPRVILEKKTKKIVITESIHFELGKDVILPDSFSLLDEVAQVIQDNANLKIRVEGHTDNIGKPAFNKKLSQKRAESVVRYLTSKGVAQERLEAQGYGPTRPLAPNDTPAGRAKNRRVEFTIIGQ